MDRSQNDQNDLGRCTMPSRGPTGLEPARTAGIFDGPARDSCYAPVFESSDSSLSCLLLALIYLLILLALIVVLILTFGSKSILCQIRQILYRIKHCRDGNADPEIDLNDPYQQHVHSFRLLYGKDAAWEQWMLANRNRYQAVFERAAVKPQVLVIAFRYDSAPIAYNPPWNSEAEHMQALEKFSELTYASYDFQFVFNGNTTTSFANAIAGIPTNASHQSGKNVFLYYELIFGHEFGHVMGVPHHYDTDPAIGTGQHMPPGDTKCLMDRTSNQYCSGCRTALFIPLNVDNDAAITAAGAVISSRYPY